ncbi:hypothetical protein [Actinomadura roseirufa]|uniref:hypothetical protein n=1 Tax=Actinomadura roseirufa TaxID=2094049 RepID=UPI001040F94E|nr:hypothetical protein [Actinomadura roseirufa]
MRRALIWAGAIAFTAGLAAGLVPLSSQGVACGSAFHGSAESERVAPLGLVHDCGDVRSLVRVPALVLFAAGGGTALAGLVLFAARGSAPPGPCRAVLGRRDGDGGG